MQIDDNELRCCPPEFLSIQNRHCFCNEICEQMMNIRRKYLHSFDKSPRLMQLARPRYTVRKQKVKCSCVRYSIEIVNVDDKRERTRTQQLAYPSVRKLLEFRKRAMWLFDWDRIFLINRLIRNSLLSVYSALQNIQPPEEPIPKKKLDKKEQKKHDRYIRKLARPKKAKKPPKIIREHVPIEQLRRYKKLAKPKRCKYCEEKPDWIFTPGMKSYAASDRLKELAKPRLFDEETLYRPLPIQVPKSALTYKPTEHVNTLAQPLEKRLPDKDTKDNAFSVSPNALKYKTSQRMIELAEPKEPPENVHLRENPFAISPAALKAKASPRIIELATPKSH